MINIYNKQNSKKTT